MWASLGREIPKPRAVLVASAHWETSLPMLSGNAKPETIHDFGGFPDALFQVRYPARGAPELAVRAVELLKGAGITAGVNGCRGLDHGAWVPLIWMYPDADVPVVEISLQPELGTARHVELGRALAPLADEASSSSGRDTRRTICATGWLTLDATSRCATRRCSPIGCTSGLPQVIPRR